jgi:hypothetical protein
MAAYRSSAALPAGPAAQARPPAPTVTPTTASATRRSPRIPGRFASRQELLRTGWRRAERASHPATDPASRHSLTPPRPRSHPARQHHRQPENYESRRYMEPFSSWLCLATCNAWMAWACLSGAPGAAAELAEKRMCEVMSRCQSARPRWPGSKHQAALRASLRPRARSR